MIFCILFYNIKLTKSLKVFFVYTLLISLSSVASSLSLLLLKTTFSYQIIVKFFSIFEFLILLYFYFLLHSKKSNLWFYISPAIIFLLFVYQSWFNSNDSNITHPLFFEFIFLIIVILGYFFKGINSSISHPIYNKIEFWISTALLLYFSGNFFFLIFVSISNVNMPSIDMQSVYSSITIIKNLILSFTFLFFGKTKRENLIDSNSNTFNTLTANNT